MPSDEGFVGRNVPDADAIRHLVAVYERGQTLEALRQAEAIAPLREWRGVKACVLASRIAAHAGSGRFASKLTVRAWRTDKTNPEALAQYGYEILGRRGPFVLWQTLRAWQEDPSAPPEPVADVLALKARAAADLRDFSAAEALLARAESIDPAKPWIRLQRAYLLQQQDQVEEALAVAQAAMALHPHPCYRPAVQSIAHLLQLLDRDEEAIRVLREADAVLQSGPVAAQLYALLSENGRWAEAEEALERFVSLAPLLEKPGRDWVNAQRARTAYRRGRRTDAARFAGAVDDDFHKAFAARLAAPPDGVERVQLNVAFVRQHFKTCAPATLAAIGRFWGMPAEHLKMAEAVCYDGTPSWQQRRWAEQNGWCVREFRVTQESAKALLERGIPFALATVEATSAHMMAAIGFDRTRGALLLRDPGQPYVIEAPTEPFLTRYRAFGPHGMAYVPESRSAELQALTLPDAALYDHYHRFRLALSGYDRSAAAATLDRMEAEAAHHALTWEARLELAAYDGNGPEQARCLDRLLELFPNNPARLLRRFDGLRDASRFERIQFLETACASKEADPALFIALARALLGDARCAEEARRWLRRAIRCRPVDSSAIHALADLLWQEGRFEDAAEYYRFSANLEEFREHLFQSWFVACRRTRHTQEAMAHLQDRFERFGARSEQPALTLAWAWVELEQPGRAREVIEEAIRRRPNDGYLLLRAASLLAGLGEGSGADDYLNAAREKVRENDWLRSRAEMAENRLDFETVLKVARDLLDREPLALDAHAAVARALARREGTLAALAALKNASARFPQHCGLQRMVVEWSREAGPEAVEAATRELLRLEPSDAWARRELAVALFHQNRGEEALREADEAARIEPTNSYSFSIPGLIQGQLGRVSEARALLRQAVALSVDNGEAINALLDLARTDADRREELAFIERELVRQVVAGDGLLAYLEIARPIVQPQPLLDILRQAHSERPDLWHAWSALVSQLGHTGRLDEALALAVEASRRFPHLPAVWLHLAMVHQWRNEPDEEIAAAERAFEINPVWNRGTIALAAALERRGRLDDARGVYERALRHAPQDPQIHAFHANLLWRQQRSAEAFATVEQALRLAPEFPWAWELLSEWSVQSGQPGRPAEFARQLTRERPGAPRVWLMLARVLIGSESEAERLAAVERAIELDSRSTEVWDLKAEFLAIAERFEEAIRACTEGEALCTMDLHTLQGRRAWIEARRRRLAEAVRLMQAVLADNKSYVWGWHQLSLWLLEQGAIEDATQALEQMQQLCPHDAWVNRQLGFLRLKQDDKGGARQAFAAALEAAPTDAGAAQNLLHLQLQNSDLAAAEATLRVMRTHQPGAATLTAEINFWLRQGNQAEAFKALETLCASPDPDPWPVDTATHAFHQAGFGRKIRRIFKRAIHSGPCNPQLGVAVVRLLLERSSYFAATRFFLSLQPGELQRRAAAPLVQGLAEHKCRLLFRWLVWRRRDVLFQDDAAWGQVGYGLTQFHRMRNVASWLSDWPQRADVQPWMLFNYCLALRHLGHYRQATEVARHVLENWGHRDGSSEMHLFLAVEEALEGAVAKAQEHLDGVVARGDTAYDQQMLALARALVEFQSAPVEERRGHFSFLCEQMAPHFGAWRTFCAMRDVRRTFSRAGSRFRREGAGLAACWWFKWRLHWQWLLSPLIPIVAALALQSVVLVAVLLYGLARWRNR